MPERVRGYASRIDVRAPPALVWRALIEPQFLKLWCAVDARVTPRVDGRYWTLLDGGVEREALIDIFEPEHRLRLIYMPTPGMPAADEVIVDDFLLAVEKGETAVRLLGSGVPVGGPWDNYFLKLRGSWERALARLKVGCERINREGPPPPVPARSTTRR